MKKTILLLIFLSAGLCFFGQNSRNYRQVVETNEVPKQVRNEFRTRYPQAFLKMWYVTNVSYWYEDYGPSYYNGWYQPRQVVVYRFDQPSYYEVEFLHQDENARAIFNRYGVWFETRTQVYHLPEVVDKALKNSEYATWTLSDYKERIEIPGLSGSVYRMHVAKGHLSSILRLRDDGKIIQVKTE